MLLRLPLVLINKLATCGRQKVLNFILVFWYYLILIQSLIIELPDGCKSSILMIHPIEILLDSDLLVDYLKILVSSEGYIVVSSALGSLSIFQLNLMKEFFDIGSLEISQRVMSLSSFHRVYSLLNRGLLSLKLFDCRGPSQGVPSLKF